MTMMFLMLDLSINDVNVLPILLSNDICVDSKDGDEYVSCYTLNRSYEFEEIFSASSLERLHHDDIGTKYVFCYSQNIAAVVQLFSHLTLPKLIGIAKGHGICASRLRKPNLQLKLLGHACGPACIGFNKPLIFSVRKKRRDTTKVIAIDTDSVAASLQEYNRAETRRHSDRRAQQPLGRKNEIRAEDTARRAVARSQLPETRREVIREADANSHIVYRAEMADLHASKLQNMTDSAIRGFPYVASTEHKMQIAREWQTSMDPLEWLPRPCAVCGKTKRHKDVTAADPQDIDLTLLQNPCLPPETNPTTYNFEAYDRAILYHVALHQKDKKGPIDTCASCLKELKDGNQPLDSWANFQYYARDELPPAVRNAFAAASMFDLMMVARSRATKITHLFSEKPNTPLYGTSPATSHDTTEGMLPYYHKMLPRFVKYFHRTSPKSSKQCVLFLSGQALFLRRKT